MTVAREHVGHNRKVLLRTEAACRVLRHLSRRDVVQITELVLAIPPDPLEVGTRQRNGSGSLKLRAMTHGAPAPIVGAALRDLSFGERRRFSRPNAARSQQH